MKPKLRFKADDGSDFPDWKKKKLGEICEYGRRRGIGAHYIGTENMLKDFGGIAINDPEAEASGSLYFEGDTLMSNIRPYLKKAWKANCDGACSTDVLIFHPTNVESDYLYCMIASDSFVAYVMNAAKGSKMPRGDKAYIMQMPLILPSLPEQRKIADLLSTVDRVIAEQRSEVDAWEQRKKGVMQKLFSQEVRFKADDGSDFPDWNEKTLGELTNLFVGKSFTSQLSENGHYVVMDMGSVSPDGSIIDTKLTDSTRDLLDKDDLIMPKDDIGGGLIIGKTAYIPCDGKYVCGDHVYRLRFGKGVDGLFMHYDINSTGPQKRLARKVTGSAQLGLNSKNVSSEIISIPSLSEQRKIANCLSSIDDVITKEKAELAKWQELKKSLLQQMFV